MKKTYRSSNTTYSRSKDTCKVAEISVYDLMGDDCLWMTPEEFKGLREFLIPCLQESSQWKIHGDGLISCEYNCATVFLDIEDTVRRGQMNLGPSDRSELILNREDDEHIQEHIQVYIGPTWLDNFTSFSKFQLSPNEKVCVLLPTAATATDACATFVMLADSGWPRTVSFCQDMSRAANQWQPLGERWLRLKRVAIHEYSRSDNVPYWVEAVMFHELQTQSGFASLTRGGESFR